MENEAGAKFCGSCGSVMEAPKAAAPAAAVQQKCPSCGTVNSPDSSFCESCGSKLNIPQPAAQYASPAPQPVTYQTTQAQQPSGHVSGAWWLLPIFLTWVGGLVAFLVLKDTNKSTALKMLWTGIILTIIWAVIYIIGAVVSVITSGF